MKALIVGLVLASAVLVGCSSSAKTGASGATTATTAPAVHYTPVQVKERTFCQALQKIKSPTNADFARLSAAVSDTYISDMLHTLQNPDPGSAGQTEVRNAMNNIVKQCHQVGIGS